MVRAKDPLRKRSLKELDDVIEEMLPHIPPETLAEISRIIKGSRATGKRWVDMTDDEKAIVTL